MPFSSYEVLLKWWYVITIYFTLLKVFNRDGIFWQWTPEIIKIIACTKQVTFSSSTSPLIFATNFLEKCLTPYAPRRVARALISKIQTKKLFVSEIIVDQKYLKSRISSNLKHLQNSSLLFLHIRCAWLLWKCVFKKRAVLTIISSPLFKATFPSYTNVKPKCDTLTNSNLYTLFPLKFMPL